MTKFFPNGKLWLMGILLLVAVTGAPALAWPITIANSSFEADTLDNGRWNYSVTGWIVTGPGGTWNPGTGLYPGGAPDGSNVAWTQNASISQTLSDTVQANYHYTLEAYVGKFSDATVHYYVELVAAESGVVLAAATGDAAYQTFNLVKATYTATNQYAGEHLKVVIGNTELTETDFDNVTLTGSAAPLPSTLLLLSSSLLGLMGWRRMRKS
jgi:hypothetical protein